MKLKKLMCQNSFEYSVNPNIKPDEIVQKWGEFKEISRFKHAW